MTQGGIDDPFENGLGEDDITNELDMMGPGSDDDLPPTPPRPSSPVPSKGLPWTPKVRSVTWCFETIYSGRTHTFFFMLAKYEIKSYDYCR